jgi:hypothetical protein
VAAKAVGDDEQMFELLAVQRRRLDEARLSHLEDPL